MKKYITIAALLAAGSALVNAEESFDATKSATITLLFNVSALESISDVNFGDDATKKPDFFMFGGNWGSGEAGSLGLANNGSSTSDTSGFWSSWVKGSGSGKSTDTGLGSIFTASTDWDTISAVALAYSFSTPDSGASTVTVAVSVKDTNGNITEYGDTKSNIVFSGVSGFSATSLTVDDTYVDSFNYLTGESFTSVDAAKSVATSLVPEPSAFGLIAGVGALALVASRRRRR